MLVCNITVWHIMSCESDNRKSACKQTEKNYATIELQKYVKHLRNFSRSYETDDNEVIGIWQYKQTKNP